MSLMALWLISLMALWLMTLWLMTVVTLWLMSLRLPSLRLMPPCPTTLSLSLLSLHRLNLQRLWVTQS